MGHHTLKAVFIKRKGKDRLVFSDYAVRQVETAPNDSAQLAHHLKLLLKGMSTARATGLAVAGEEAVVKIIKQPPMAVGMLRQALKLHSSRMLSQDCNSYTLDCDLVRGASAGGEPSPEKNVSYLVGGLPRTTVRMIHEGLGKARLQPVALQLAPVGLFNAFEFCNPGVFASEAFLLLDIGHAESSLIIGKAGEICLVRSLNLGAAQLLDPVTADGAIDRDSAITLIENGDIGIGEAISSEIEAISREIQASIGFFEGEFDQGIQQVYISGGPARSQMILQMLSDHLSLSCELWDPLGNCENNLSKAKKESYQRDYLNLGVAFGAALEVLHPEE